MKKNLFKVSPGQVSRVLLILAIVVLFAAIITYLIIKMADKPPAPIVTEEPSVPQPVYEQAIGNIKFTFGSARNLGNTLRTSQIKNARYTWQKKDITTTEKFIEITINAQNKGKENIENRSWGIGDVIDSEGRRFVKMPDSAVSAWLPETDTCGDLLKPEFEPATCTKIYEVSKISTELKVEVVAGEENTPNGFSSDKATRLPIDLIIY